MSTFSADCLEEGLDYAGLFPPASLPLAGAIAEYGSLKMGPQGKLVRGFSITTRQLSELNDDLVSSVGRLDLCLIGRGSDSLEGWETNLESDAEAINATVNRFAENVGLRTYEVRIPAEIDPRVATKDLSAFEEGQAYLEIPLHNPNFDIASFTAAVSESDLGLKARTGGVKTGSVPPTPRLAELIVACAQCEVPLKGTAGLHHAYPHKNATTGDLEFGFLNLIAAVALAWEYDFSVEEVSAVLAAPTGLIAPDHRLSYAGNALTDAARDLIADGFLAIGTCSVAEVLAEMESARG